MNVCFYLVDLRQPTELMVSIYYQLSNMGGHDLFIYGQNSISIIIIVQFFFFVLEGWIIDFFWIEPSMYTCDDVLGINRSHSSLFKAS